MTRVMLEFLRSTVPVFEEFLTVLQRSGPTVHVLYDANYALDPFELNEKICSGRSTERCTWLSTEIYLLPRYQGSTS